MKTRTPDLLGMSYACANMVHSPGYADDLRQYTTLNTVCSSDVDDIGGVVCSTVLCCGHGFCMCLMLCVLLRAMIRCVLLKQGFWK